ncbi:hypothetical protein D3C78_486710 [compost metagenome]
MVDLTPVWQGQRGQVAERVVLVAQLAVGGGLLRQPAKQVVSIFQLFLGDPELLAGTRRVALNAQQPVGFVVLEGSTCIAG